MRVAVLTIDPWARISIRLVAALLRSQHDIVAVIAPRDATSGDHTEDADWEALQRITRSRVSPASDRLLNRFTNVSALLEQRPFPYHRIDDLRGIECQTIIRASAADLLILPAAPLLPLDVFGIPRYGTINFHAGVVPWYRGTAALYHALHNKDLLGVGYTLLLVDEGVDTGDILHKQVVPVLPGDSVVTIHDRCERLATLALMQIVTALGREADVPRTSQRGLAGFTYRGIPTARQWEKLEALMKTAAWQSICGPAGAGGRRGTGGPRDDYP
jgi:methionyl-tRNA formyltransferase